jgi:hypothetical protein
MLLSRTKRCLGVGVGPRSAQARPFVCTGAQLKRHLVQAGAERQQLHTTDERQQVAAVDTPEVRNPAELRAAASSSAATLTL